MKTRFALMMIVLACVSCNKPLASARVEPNMGYVSKSFTTDSTNALAAVRWALKINGYSIANENVGEGIISTTWVPTTSDSHIVELFNRNEFVINGAYYQLEVHVSGEDGRTRIDVGARVKSVVANLKSTGIQERKVLAEVGNYLRSSEPELSNIGLQE